MLKRTTKRAGYILAPQLTEDILTYRQLSKELQALQDLRAHTQDLGCLVDYLCMPGTFAACQKKNEILGLLSLLRSRPPRRICEIGSARGGALFLFSQIAAADAAILSVDIAYNRPRCWAHRRLGHESQKITCMGADSHSSRTLAEVRRWLGNDKIDFLFIDGDHSFDGVSSDYSMYSPWVRPGGIIAFHDIIPDYRTRYGTPTEAYVGEVPRFWSELKQTCGCRASELIEDPMQDGMGIGVLWSPE